MKFLITLFLFTPILVYSQVQLERQVISPLGLNGGLNVQISSTAGQVEYTTEESPNHILTQGFEQETLVSKSIVFSIVEPQCDNGDPWVLNIILDSVCPSGEGIILIDGLEEESSIDLEEPGTYFVEISCSNGSNFNTTVLLEEIELPGCDLIFYNVITPASEINYWPIDNITSTNLGQNTVQIFNRWGKVVWSGENYNNDDIRWEGLDQEGSILLQGTYYYVVEVNGNIFKGFIELIR